MSDPRSYGRAADALRPVRIERGYARHAEGSALIDFGDTRVLCTASVEERVPAFLRGKARGWLTAEYGMLPRSTGTRSERANSRASAKGRQMRFWPEGRASPSQSAQSSKRSAKPW